MPTPLLIAITCLLCAAAALALTPLLRAEASRGSRWLGLRTHVPLATAAGAGAALLADNPAELVALAGTGVLCAGLVVIDLVELRLPDRWVAAALVVLFGPLAAASALGSGWEQLGRAALAAVACLGFYFVLAFVTPSGLGLGDVKFAAVIGGLLGWFGWQQVAAGTLAAFVLNAVVAGVVLATGRGGRGTDVPFGPSMLAGAALALALAVLAPA